MDAVNYFFINKDEASCGMKKCELLEAGCKDPYNGSKLSI